jgi:hypothetical protein
MKTTITEALADIKTSLARIAKKRLAIKAYLGRDARIRDPMEGDGGSREFIRRELQSIYDLETRIINIRSAVQASNLACTVEIEGRAMTLANWLNWRREVSAGAKGFLDDVSRTLDQMRKQAIQRGQPITTQGNNAPNPEVGEWIVNVNERDLAEEIDRMERILGQLDGKLSLLNATTTIDV